MDYFRSPGEQVTWLVWNWLTCFLYSSQCSKSSSMTRSRLQHGWKKKGRQVQCTVAVPWDGISLFYEHLAEVFFESDCYTRAWFTFVVHKRSRGPRNSFFSNNASACLIPDAFKTCTTSLPTIPSRNQRLCMMICAMPSIFFRLALPLGHVRRLHAGIVESEVPTIFEREIPAE